MRKIVIPVVAVLVLGVATIAWARAGHHGSEHRSRYERAGLLEQVLEDLVEGETITQEQSDAIVAALEEKRAEVLEARRTARAHLESFLEDDVLTSEEIAELPFAARLTDPDGPFAGALEDGQITKEELEDVRSEHGKCYGGGGRHRHAEKEASESSVEDA